MKTSFSLDLRCIDQSFITYKNVDFISGNACRVLALAYAGGESLTHPLISPLFGDLAGLPNTYIQAGTKEVFIDSIRKFKNKLEECEVKVKLDEFENMVHVFQAFQLALPTIADEAFSRIGGFFKQVFSNNDNHKKVAKL